jgi:hypothetical protein
MKKNIVIAIVVFAVTAGVYLLTAHLLRKVDPPHTAYFNYLADAFLHGRTYLVNPPTTADLTQFEGRWYVPFLPLPAFLLLPWVGITGPEKTSTVLFGSLMGALNAALVFLLLQALAKRRWIRLPTIDNLGLTLLFSFGCVEWYIAMEGSVWFLSQVCTITFVLLSLWIAVEFHSPALSGIALALALFGRPHLILVCPLLFAIGIQLSEEERGEQHASASRWIMQWILILLFPLLFSVCLILGYNYLRFGNYLDFGYLTESVNPSLIKEFKTYGQFNLHYVPHNFWSMILAGPEWDAKRKIISPNRDGMSLFLTTPAILFVFQALKKTWLSLGAWIALALILVPLLTYYNTGWWQFGYRFGLDFMPVVVILLAIAAGERLRTGFWILIWLGVGINLWGAWWFAQLHAT